MSGVIVVGVDGSEHGQRAVDWAAAEAKLRGATLRLVHSWTFPPALPGAAGELPHIDIEAAAKQVLEDAAVRCPEGVTVEREIANDSPARALIQASESAELVVVGSRGTGGFAGLLLGSVSQQVLHHARCPVVVVPGAERD